MKRTTKKKAFTFITVFFFCMLAVALALMLSGCHPDKSGIDTVTDGDKAIDACIAAGGVPKFSKFNGAFSDCVWPPAGVTP